MTDLVERLLERNTRLDAATPNAMLHFMDGIKPLIAEAATALEAKDKELAALREQLRIVQNAAKTIAICQNTELEHHRQNHKFDHNLRSQVESLQARDALMTEALEAAEAILALQTRAGG